MAIPLSAQHIETASQPRVDSWAKTASIVIGASFLLRLCFIGIQELLPEEAYYWQFSRRLDWSYLDHPGMVAWLISLGTAVFGHTEFGVRCGALLCSALSAFCLWKLTLLFFSRQIALSSVMLFSALPYFFISGYLITPDSPLVLFWTATLYFLVRALRDSSRQAWLGVGVCLGLGMVSKYSIALLGASTILFMLLHRPSRHWFLSPWPYCAACISLILFTPVIYWNAQHDWVSFAFQTSRRLEAPSEFGLPTLLSSILCLLTPTGAVAACLCLAAPAAQSERSDTGFRTLFLRVYLGLPIAVFTIFSLTHIPKLNWTGPSFIIALPFIAAMLHVPVQSGRWHRFVEKSWQPTLAVLFFIYLGAMCYFGTGIPGIGYSRSSQRYVGWTNLGRQINTLLESKTDATGARPLIVGMDKHFLASEIGFYTPSASGKPPLPVEAVAGRNLFGMNSLMWELWAPPKLRDATLLLVARSRDDLEKTEILKFVKSLDPVVEITTQTRGSTSGKYFYRWAYGYSSGRESRAASEAAGENS